MHSAGRKGQDSLLTPTPRGPHAPLSDQDSHAPMGCHGVRLACTAGRWPDVAGSGQSPADGPWCGPNRSPRRQMAPGHGASRTVRRQVDPGVARPGPLAGRQTPCSSGNRAVRPHMVPSAARTRALTGKIDRAVREPGHPPAPDPWCATNRALRRKMGPVWRSSGHAPADGPPGATRPGPLAGSPTPLQYGNQATRRQMAHRCGAARVISRRRARAIRTGNRLPQPSQVAPRPRTRARSSVTAQDCSLSGSGKIPVVILHPSHIHFESRPAGSGRRQ